MMEFFIMSKVIRSKTHCLELYPDCIDHMQLINDILYNQVMFECGYAAILHDMDRREDGEFKKPHFHIVFALARECSKDSFIKRVHSAYPTIVDNYFYSDSREHSIRYLVHADDPDKYQYDPSLIISHDLNIDRYLKRQFIADEEDKIIKILDHIQSYPKESREELMRWVLNNNLWSEYRRSYSIINDIIKERKQDKYYDVANELFRVKQDIKIQLDHYQEGLYNIRREVSKLNNDRVFYMREIDRKEELH